ncbi:MAG: desulfoferrodoxin family protein [Candidatus Izemoplasmatales bacterium]|jgi:superoxide reductase|nr:desulfoferrodoxin family protein [bacterium]MDZ4195946.1 desulfoferrodoxin family protein [Candidatus Izemoplasmatales bacterium]
MNIFYCKHCKRIVYTYYGGGNLTCCGDEMTLLQPKTKDVGNEKHLPVIERLSDDLIKVSVGSVMHPMTDDHWIQWVFVAQNQHFQIKTLLPNETPVVEFTIQPNQSIKVYEFCNLHGLWLTELV